MPPMLQPHQHETTFVVVPSQRTTDPPWQRRQFMAGQPFLKSQVQAAQLLQSQIPFLQVHVIVSLDGASSKQADG
jgi:hypothetical protein